MIQEQYVSFETAKLLKEKGFNEPCHTWQRENENINYCDIPLDYNEMFSDEYLVPTQQMVMRWLREVFSIHISVYPFNRTLPITDKTVYTCDIATKKYSSQEGHLRGVWNTYEEACEAAIKYCLENLI